MSPSSRGCCGGSGRLVLLLLRLWLLLLDWDLAIGLIGFLSLGLDTGVLYRLFYVGLLLAVLRHDFVKT